MMHRIATLAAAVILLAAPSAIEAAAGSPAPADAGTSFKVGAWTLHASLLDANFKSGDFSTPNRLTLDREGGDIVGDRASGNFKTKHMTLYGHVVMHDSEGNFAGLSSTQPSQSRGPATLTADQAQIDGAAKVYTAIGNVHYVQADTTVDSDKGTLNDDTHELFLQGHVHVVQGDRNMVADHVRYNTITGDAHAEGDVTMQFPSQVNARIATPRPIHIKNPLQRNKPEATPAPTPSP